MPADVDQTPRSAIGSSLSLVFPVLVVLSVLVLIAPVPAMVLDLMLAANVTASVLVLLTTISVRRPLEFSSFPSLLLVATLVRLVLNVASTRLILTRAPFEGTEAAGAVIEAFGRFVAQDQLLVGLILFGIVVVIQFVVVTKGSTRISEVAARFALDGMPGKQQAIDADLTAGVITSDEAQRRRAEVSDQADFYAAMDGAGKFVRGDAIAGVLITLINLIGGLAIGMIQHGMSPVQALEVFATLTIGDGLVSQVPGFLISLSAGILATRSSRETQLSNDVIRQTFRDSTSLFLAAAFVGGLAFTGLPMLPLLALGMGCALLGVQLRKSNSIKPAAVENVKSAPTSTPATRNAPRARVVNPEDKLTVEPIELELGFRLIKLADPETGGDLLDRVTQLRSKVAAELGIILPKVKIRDSLRLKDLSYQIKLRDVPVATGELRPEMLLAINPGFVSGDLAGVDVVEPANGRPAKWIEPALAEQARVLGYRVIEPIMALMSHLSEVVKSHGDELLTRQHVHQLLDHLRQSSPKVVDELIPELLKPSHVHQVLSNLLKERVPIRDLETILQTLTDHADRTRDLVLLTELCRQSLARQISQQYRDAGKTLRAIVLDPALEDVLQQGFELTDRGVQLRLSPQVIEGVGSELNRHANKLIRAGYPPVAVCHASIRPALRLITATLNPRLAILSFSEVTRDTKVQPAGQVPVNAIKLATRRDSKEPNYNSLLAAAS